MIVLVCGGREFKDREWVNITLDTQHAESPITLLVHGGARGADMLAHEWAMLRKVACSVHQAKWNIHGRAAGPIRNQEMLESESPDLVIAFPGNAGTADTVRRAKSSGVPVKEIIYAKPA